MGYSMQVVPRCLASSAHPSLLQWSITPAPANLSDIIISRLLEHYSLTQPAKTSIFFRTFRSGQANQPGTSSRLLTTIMYSQPVPVMAQQVSSSNLPRDDTMYLFLEDRTGHVPRADSASSQISGQAAAQAQGQAGGSSTTTTAKTEQGIEEDGFEIIDLPPDTPAPNPTTGTTATTASGAGSNTARAPLPASALTPMARGKRGTYRILAVKPASNVLPLFQNLLSPFVMGLTKAARAATATTAQTATPTPLGGTPFTLTSLTYPPLSPPYPGIVITAHCLSSPASSVIFLEGEWPGQSDPDLARTVLRECLTGCVPEGLGGDRRFHEWEDGVAKDGREKAGGGKSGSADKGWEGVERTRRMTMLLAKCLREASYI